MVVDLPFSLCFLRRTIGLPYHVIVERAIANQHGTWGSKMWSIDHYLLFVSVSCHVYVRYVIKTCSGLTWWMTTLCTLRTVTHQSHSCRHTGLLFTFPSYAGSSNWKRVLLSLQTQGKRPATEFKDFSLLNAGSSLKYLHSLPPDEAQRRLDTYFK